MSSINRDELEKLKRATDPTRPKFDENPENITIEMLRKRAIKATSKALNVLIEATHDELIPTAQKLKAAETILEIAYGKDKSGLRVEDTGEDAILAIERLIRESQFSPTLPTDSKTREEGDGPSQGTGMDDE